MTTDLHGHVEVGFEGVRTAFARNFAERGEVGAAVAVHVEGRLVVDLWGGVADPADGRPYGEDTVQVVFSATKGAAAACANLLVQRGALDLDAPVAQYWPDFAEAGKQAVTVAWLLGHRAGLPTVDAPLTFDDLVAWEPVTRALERQKPHWEPGTAHGYHAITFGWLVGEVVRRVDGRTIGRFFHDEIAEPLGLDLWIGLPAAHADRVAAILPAPMPPPEELADLARDFGPGTLRGRTLSLNGALTIPDYGRPEALAAEIPSATGVANARALSRFYAGLVGTVEGGPPEPVLTRAQIDRARTCQTHGEDRILSTPAAPMETTYGLGFQTASPAHARLGGTGGFGHSGSGGSLGFADPENGIAFGYTPNQMTRGFGGDPRGDDLVRAVYEAVGAKPAYLA